MSKRMITTLLVILMLTACVPVGSNTPQTPTTGIGPTATIDVNQDPGGVAVSFLDAWEQGNYEGMYSLLAPNNQREYSAEEFISIYQGTATTIQQTAIDTVPLSELRVTDTTAQLAFRVTYTSAVLGDIVEDMTMNLILAGAVLGQEEQPTPFSARLTVAVPDFENKTGDPEQAHWRSGVAGFLRSQLDKIRTVRVLSESALEYGFRRLD